VVIVQAELKLHVPCPNPECAGGSVAGQLKVGQWSRWTCDACNKEFNITRVSSGEFDVELTGKKKTPVTITMRADTIPAITLRFHAWRYAHAQDKSDVEFVEGTRYYYDEHTCPANWFRDVVEIECRGDHDPHGLFKFVSLEQGHNAG
jgi:hypothetical protein